jgi:uncharacterized protein (DUF302 family)
MKRTNAVARPTAVAFAAALVAQVATAEIAFMPSPKSVGETMDDLEAAVTAAGATIVARVDHAVAAADAGMTLGEAQLLIFGNPQIGTPVMQQDPLAGLMLPLRVLVYDDDGQTQLAWVQAAALFEGTAVDVMSQDVQRIVDAMVGLTEAAAAPDVPQQAPADDQTAD